MLSKVGSDPLVMLVDDSPDQLQMMVDAFTQAGFATITAVSGDIALDLLRRTLPDLVVLDAVMPGLDGFKTVGSSKPRRVLLTFR